jgi:hypothetical protein
VSGTASDPGVGPPVAREGDGLLGVGADVDTVSEGVARPLAALGCGRVAFSSVHAVTAMSATTAVTSPPLVTMLTATQ